MEKVIKMRKQNREKGIYYAIRQYDEAYNELISILADLLPPCKIDLKDDIIYLLFDNFISIYSIAYALSINESFVTYISPLTNKRNHFSIPLEFIRG